MTDRTQVCTGCGSPCGYLGLFGPVDCANMQCRFASPQSEVTQKVSLERSLAISKEWSFDDPASPLYAIKEAARIRGEEMLDAFQAHYAHLTAEFAFGAPWEKLRAASKELPRVEVRLRTAEVFDHGTWKFHFVTTDQPYPIPYERIRRPGRPSFFLPSDLKDT